MVRSVVVRGDCSQTGFEVKEFLSSEDLVLTNAAEPFVYEKHVDRLVWVPLVPEHKLVYSGLGFLNFSNQASRKSLFYTSTIAFSSIIRGHQINVLSEYKMARMQAWSGEEPQSEESLLIEYGWFKQKPSSNGTLYVRSVLHGGTWKVQVQYSDIEVVH